MSRLGSSIIAEVYGQSHSPRVGVKISGLPPGYVIDTDIIQRDLDRRSAKNNPFSTPRKEADQFVIESGLVDSFTSGNVLEGYIENGNIAAKSYDNLLDTPRPGHADYVARVKFGDSYNATGGGAFSGRLTAPMVIMGSVARQILAKQNIKVSAYISDINGINCGSYGSSHVDKLTINNAECDNADINSDELGRLLIKDRTHERKAIEVMSAAQDMGDSIGGKIECVVSGMPVGVGNAMWSGLESRIAYGLYGVPAVKAVEFGSGCDFASMCGSVANDSFYYDGDIVRTRTNHNGGINGGISNGMDINLRVTIKATPSISIEQDTVDLKRRKNTKLAVKGRHDCCILPRAVVVIESIVAYMIMDVMSEEGRL